MRPRSRIPWEQNFQTEFPGERESAINNAERRVYYVRISTRSSQKPQFSSLCVTPFVGAETLASENRPTGGMLSCVLLSCCRVRYSASSAKYTALLRKDSQSMCNHGSRYLAPGMVLMLLYLVYACITLYYLVSFAHCLVIHTYGKHCPLI